jgi:tripartite-type tricarboxylate transporter receptor subunit TctC
MLPAFAAEPGQDAFPQRSIKLIVPFAAGGAVDIVARTIANELGTQLGQPIVIDNRAGAGGTIGATVVARAPNDGYTLLMGTSSTHGTNVVAFRSLPYDPINDFEPIAKLVTMPFILVTNPRLNVANVAELIEASKRQNLSFASWGEGSSNHLAMEYFMSLTGAKFLHIPYKGGLTP